MRASVTVREPEYSEADLLAILASRREDQRPRGSHGRLLSEATDPANQYRYVVPLPTKDFAESALSKARAAYRKQYGDEAEMDSLLWTVELPDK